MDCGENTSQDTPERSVKHDMWYFLLGPKGRGVVRVEFDHGSSDDGGDPGDPQRSM